MKCCDADFPLSALAFSHKLLANGIGPVLLTHAYDDTRSMGECFPLETGTAGIGEISHSTPKPGRHSTHKHSSTFVDKSCCLSLLLHVPRCPVPFLFFLAAKTFPAPAYISTQYVRFLRESFGTPIPVDWSSIRLTW